LLVVPDGELQTFFPNYAASAYFTGEPDTVVSVLGFAAKATARPIAA
jgi:hypothetical protein